MSKFLSFSFLFHLSLLALVLSHFHSPTHPHEHNDHEKSYVTINLSPKKLTQKKTAPKTKKLIKKTPKTKRISKSDFNASKILKTKTNENLYKPTPHAQKSSASSLSASKKQITSYKDELYFYIKNKRHYPPMAAKLKQEGTLKVSITILNDGKFETVKLLESSKHRALNDGTLKFLNQIAKFKPLPKNKTKEDFEVSIRYQL